MIDDVGPLSSHVLTTTNFDSLDGYGGRGIISRLRLYWNVEGVCCSNSYFFFVRIFWRWILTLLYKNTYCTSKYREICFTILKPDHSKTWRHTPFGMVIGFHETLNLLLQMFCLSAFGKFFWFNAHVFLKQ